MCRGYDNDFAGRKMRETTLLPRDASLEHGWRQVYSRRFTSDLHFNLTSFNVKATSQHPNQTSSRQKWPTHPAMKTARYGTL